MNHKRFYENRWHLLRIAEIWLTEPGMGDIGQKCQIISKLKEADMIVRSTLLAVVIFLGSLAPAGAQTFVNTGLAGPFTGLGWNFGYVAYCTTYNDGVTTWHYAFFDGGGYAVTNNPAFATLGASACHTGNSAGIHVTRLNPFQWNGVATFPHR